MIKTFCDGSWIEDKNLMEALGLSYEDNPVISIVGGGGKTTTCRRLMRDYCDAGRSLIVTTTTHMQREDGNFYVGEENISRVKDILKMEGKAWAGCSCGETMMKSFSVSFVSELVKLSVPLVIEADGAKMMPCKVPSEKEPVIIPETNMILAVYGMDAVGKKVKDVCFRLELVKSFLQKSEDEILTTDDIIRIASSQTGGMKGLRKNMDYQVLLNKADDDRKAAYATEIAEGLVKAGVKKVHMSSFLIDKEFLGGRFS